MYQGTTPTIPIRIKNANLIDAKVHISLYDEQKKVLYDYESGRDFIVSQDGYDSVTSLSLTQEMTLGLGNGLISIQARYVFPDGGVGATNKQSIQVQSILNKEVLEYE